MRVRSELTWRRLAAALLALAVFPALMAFAAVSYRSPDLPPGPPAYNPLPLRGVPMLAALQTREIVRSRRVTSLAPDLTAPTLVPPAFPEPLPSIALPPRAAAYDIGELRTLLPSAFGTVDGAVLLLASIEVPPGAQLNIDAATTPRLRMLSSPAGFVTIIALGGTIEVRGSEQAPVQISSWDPSGQDVDREPGDGRAFLLAKGGRMDVTHADMGYLGFGTGTSSGVAWRGSQHPPDRPDLPGRHATGDVRGSTLHDNWFGAYTYEAAGMHWTGNIFRDNEAYGFDPHDSSDDFVLVRNVAHGNGRHGIIFSRGCDRNLLKDNVSYDNRGHGFMIDDGRSEDTPDERAKRLPSNQNVLVGNHAYANDGSGIEIEGGEGTVVEGNRLERNHVGVRVKDDASALVADNTLQRSRLAGVDVLAGAGKVRIKGNEITGGWAGVALNAQNAAALAGNRFQGSSAPLVIGGQPRREDGALEVIGRLFRWNPLLILWTAILGVPTVLTLRHLVRTSAGGRHRARARWS